MERLGSATTFAALCLKQFGRSFCNTVIKQELNTRLRSDEPSKPTKMEAFRAGIWLAIVVILYISYANAADPKPKPTTKPAPKKPTTPKVTTPKPTKPPKPAEEGKDYYVTLKLLGQECNADLSNVASAKFQELRAKLYDATLQMYANHDFYQDLLVLSFDCTEGGVLAHFAIRFTKKGKGHMDRFSQAVQAGKIGELEIQPSYIEVADLDQNLLVGGVPGGAAGCQAGCPQTCAPACDASCCGPEQAQGQEQTIYVPIPMAQAPPPPPPAPAPALCAVGCPSTCAPACTPTCCFVQKRWLAKKAKAQAKNKQPQFGRY
eukprot:gene12965-14298_t